MAQKPEHVRQITKFALPKFRELKEKGLALGVVLAAIGLAYSCSFLPKPVTAKVGASAKAAITAPVKAKRTPRH